MDGGFDPYHKWLGISAKDQPPNYYRLLGIDLFESDPDVIVATFNRQRAHLLTYQNGPYKSQAQQILQEVIAARTCLSDPLARQAYDAQLQLTTPIETGPSEAAPEQAPSDFVEVAASPRRSNATRSPRPARSTASSTNPNDPDAPKEKLWLGIGREGQIWIVSVGSVVFVLTMLYLLFGGGSSKSRHQTESVPQSFPNVQQFRQPSPSKTPAKKPTTNKTSKPKKQ